MTGAVTALYRYPIKGFTPQRVAAAFLDVGAAFPFDRLWAVEDGPSGFDPTAPAHISKSRFTVLAKIAEVAKARTFVDEARGVLTAEAHGMPNYSGRLGEPGAREAFAEWLTRLLGDAASGPLKVLEGEGHRFLDDPRGHVSILNLASVDDFAVRLGRPVDPLRFRANVHVEGWPAWVENDWRGHELMLGQARATVVGTITRCAAPDVDPTTAERDIAVTARLHEHYGHLLCGVYVQVTKAGELREGDAATLS